MVEHFSIQEDSQTVVSFNVEREMGLRFQAQCQARGTTPAEVLTEFIDFYLAATPDSSQVTSAEKRTTLIEDYIFKKIDDYLQDYLNEKIIAYVEHYLNLRFQNSEEQLISDQIENPNPMSDLSSVSSNLETTETSLELPQSNLKSAKELAKILGVSAPYITTLNRIGELAEWGWEDSGQRRGKTILYQPINPPH